MRPRCVGDVLEGSRRTQLRASLLLSFRFLCPWLSCLSLKCFCAPAAAVGVLRKPLLGFPLRFGSFASFGSFSFGSFLSSLSLDSLSFLFSLVDQCHQRVSAQTHLRWLPLGTDLSLVQSKFVPISNLSRYHAKLFTHKPEHYGAPLPKQSGAGMHWAHLTVHHGDIFLHIVIVIVSDSGDSGNVVIVVVL